MVLCGPAVQSVQGPQTLHQVGKYFSNENIYKKYLRFSNNPWSYEACAEVKLSPVSFTDFGQAEPFYQALAQSDLSVNSVVQADLARIKQGRVQPASHQTEIR